MDASKKSRKSSGKKVDGDEEYGEYDEEGEYYEEEGEEELEEPQAA